MALPIQSTPSYKMTVPSTGAEVKFRPFLIKEEKSLLIAQQSDDSMTMVSTLRDVINDCTFGSLDIEKLALFDLEYMFTQIRSKSVGEDVELIMSCDTCTDEKAKAKVVLDLSKIEITKDPEHTNKLELFDDVGVVMKYPNFELLKELEKVDSSDFNLLFDIMARCIDYVYNTDEVFHAAETPKQELVEFINNMTQEQFMKLQKFFETMPKLSTTVVYDCPVCNKHHDKTVEGLANFF